MRNHDFCILSSSLRLPIIVFLLNFFSVIIPLRADIVYLDEDGNIISSEKTELDNHGNVVVIPAEKSKEETAIPSSGTGDKVADADCEKFELDYEGISTVFEGGIPKAVLRQAPPDAVHLVIPDGVTEVDGKAFRQCKKLESVVFPNSLERIPSNIFFENKTLKSVVIPARASIGYSAFNGCTALESVTIANPDDGPPHRRSKAQASRTTRSAAVSHCGPSTFRTVSSRSRCPPSPDAPPWNRFPFRIP